MPADTDPLEDTEDSVVYTWTIRTLYAVALGLNIYLLWQTSKDDAELAVMRQRMTTAWAKVTKPLRTQREWNKAVGRMHWQAIEIVEEGAPSDGT